MKKTAVLLLTFILLCSVCGPFSARAAGTYTKDDLVNKVSESMIYKYIKGDVINLARTVEATDEQIDALYPLAEKFVALKIADQGSSADDYKQSDIQNVLALIDQACEIMNYTYTFDVNAKSAHPGDVTFRLYDQNQKLIYTFEGDVVRTTGESNMPLLISMILLGGAMLATAIVIVKKRARA